MSQKTKPAALSRRLADLYGLEAASLGQPVKGYRNQTNPIVTAAGRQLNLIIYKAEPDMLATINRADRVSGYLHSAGWPTRQRASPQLAVIKSAVGQRYAGLYNYLLGATIPWEAYTQAHIKAVGAALGRLHLALAECPTDDLPVVEAIYRSIIGRMTTYWRNTGVRQAMATKLGVEFNPDRLTQYQRLLEFCQKLPGRQALHMDFVRGNLLFGEIITDGLPVITGVLDFEKVAAGHRLFDVARTEAFLLVDCKFKTTAQVSRYFRQSGYIKRGQTGRPPQRLLEKLIELFLLYDFYKFLKHNPYEALSGNEHYCRTRDLLLEKQLLRRVG